MVVIWGVRTAFFTDIRHLWKNWSPFCLFLDLKNCQISQLDCIKVCQADINIYWCLHHHLTNHPPIKFASKTVQKQLAPFGSQNFCLSIPFSTTSYMYECQPCARHFCKSLPMMFCHYGRNIASAIYWNCVCWLFLLFWHLHGHVCHYF